MCEDYPCCGHTPQDPCGPQFYDTPADKQALFDQIEAQTDWRATNAGKAIRDNAGTPEFAAGKVIVGFDVRLRYVG